MEWGAEAVDLAAAMDSKGISLCSVTKQRPALLKMP